MKLQWLLLALCIQLIAAAISDTSQYHSIKPPFGVQNWALGNDAYMTEDFIRLAEDRQSKKGWFWNNLPCYYADWEVVFQFRIHGVSRVGADGMAFWYTQDSKVTGDVFGNQDRFKGLGIVLDTYDNDNTGKHPYLAALINDGTHNFNHNHDDAELIGNQLGGCSIRARNLANPSSIKVTYNRGVLEVMYDLENTGTWTPCVKQATVLSLGYYFGFTAATGHLADNHDLYSFEARNLDGLSRNQPTPITEQSFSKLLGSIHQEIRALGRSDSRAPISSGKGSDSSALDSKIDALSSQISKLQNDIRFASDKAAPSGRSGDGCAGVQGSVNNVHKSIEKFEKEQNRKHSELKEKLIQISREIENSQGFDVFGLLNLVVLIALAVFIVIAYLIYDEDKRKRHFSIR